MSLSENIKRFRIKKGYSQAFLAKKTGLSEITIRKYESNERTPKLQNVAKIAAALDVTISDLQKEFIWSSEDVEQYLENDIHLDELKLLQNYRVVNDDGKKKIIDYSEDIASNDKYKE